MLKVIKSYLKFLWESNNEHGVHSPFVFDLITQCISDTKSKPDYFVLKRYRQLLLQNKDTIVVTDFGAGSKIFNSNTRSISKIARVAGISNKRAELLFRMTRYFQPENILEIGTSLGLATAALTLGNPRSKITTLEGCKETSRIAKQQFQQFRFDNVSLVVTDFDSDLQSLKRQSKVYDMVYFDGNHQKAATLHYFELLLPTISNNTVWIFDDIHWSEEMEEAWDIIKNNPRVTVTIDTFAWGLVFFRAEQKKEHFVIRT